MKALENVFKALSAAIVLIVGYVNTHYTPLFWVLIALVAYDLIINSNREGQQMPKLVSAAVSLGLPTTILSHYADPNVLKYVVVILTLTYLRVDFPDLFSRLARIKWSTNPAENAAVQKEVTVTAELLDSKVNAMADRILSAIEKPSAPARQAPTDAPEKPLNAKE